MPKASAMPPCVPKKAKTSSVVMPESIGMPIQMASQKYRHGDLIYLSCPQDGSMKPIEVQDLSTIGGRVKAKRLAMGLNQTELAELAGIRQPSLSAIETNETVEITAKVMGALCAALKLPWEYVMHGGIGDPADVQAQAELLALYRALPTASARLALLHAARTVSAAMSQDEGKHPQTSSTAEYKLVTKTDRKAVNKVLPMNLEDGDGSREAGRVPGKRGGRRA